MRKKATISIIVIIAIFIFALPTVFAGTAFFNVQLPLLGTDSSLVDWQYKSNTANGSYLGTSANKFYLSTLSYLWIWTDVKFANSGIQVQFSPKVKIYNDTKDNWLGGYGEFDPTVGDQIRLRESTGVLNPYSYARGDWNYN